MEINKEELKQKFKEQDMDYVFSKASEMAKFILIRKFNIFEKEKINDMAQECLIAFWKKILKNKVDPNNNVFSYMWQSHNYRILEILRKENNRKRIAKFVPYEEMEGSYTLDILDFNSGESNKYQIEIA